MIYAKFEDLKMYQHIPHHKDIITFIRNNDLLTLPYGDFDVLGKEVYIRVMHGITESIEKRKFETHRVYADLQIVLLGAEKIQTTSSNYLEPISDYDPGNDIQFFTAPPGYTSDIIVEKNQFVFFFPGESHKPMCYRESESESVFKVVFKIKA